MYGKLLIKANLEVVTGMHIGGSNLFSAIGSVDSVVIRDARTQQPIVPGSSIKGKLRTLLQKSLSKKIVLNEPNDDKEVVKRLFGSSKKNDIKKARLQFCDAFLTNADELKDSGYTEIKFENAINRATAISNPRQIERVVRGAVFGLEIIYDIAQEQEAEEDFEHIARAMKLLHADYLGGHGTRGYGRVRFRNIDLLPVESSLADSKLSMLKGILKEVENYEL
ncbi:MAG: type III-A CRISPR-associated RAMP protein Csm3 [Clostridiales bacterium]|nr:type III-A CRISPR-associated RAMP protein Csm3 [Clostridiales bacterium]